MNSHADKLTALCEEASRVISRDEPAPISGVALDIREALDRGVTGNLNELTRALDATTALVSRVERIRNGLASELERVRDGRHAIGGYKLRLVPKPRAVDVSG